MVNPYATLDELLAAQNEGKLIEIIVRTGDSERKFSSEYVRFYFNPSLIIGRHKETGKELVRNFIAEASGVRELWDFGQITTKERCLEHMDQLIKQLTLDLSVMVTVDGNNLYEGSFSDFGQPDMPSFYFTPDIVTIQVHSEKNVLHTEGTIQDRGNLRSMFHIFKKFDMDSGRLHRVEVNHGNESEHSSTVYTPIDAQYTKYSAAFQAYESGTPVFGCGQDPFEADKTLIDEEFKLYRSILARKMGQKTPKAQCIQSPDVDVGYVVGKDRIRLTKGKHKQWGFPLRTSAGHAYVQIGTERPGPDYNGVEITRVLNKTLYEGRII